MPTESEHIQKTLHNIDAIDYLRAEPKFSDWTAVVTFYAALHIVEAVFFHDKKNCERRHGHNHEERESILKGVNSYKNIYLHYRPLQSASIIARYLYDQSRQAITFQKYMSSSKVQEKLISYHLAQLIKTAEKFLNPTSAKLLIEKFDRTFKN